MKIRELLDSIRKRDLVLPEFQREYVWTLDQAKQLFTSLYQSYPVGGLLFWKTDTPPELKNILALPDRLGTIEVILDGQQRLTTLYMLITGDIPPFYTGQDIQNDPRHLYFNLQEGEFQYYQPSRMDNNDLWHPAVDCFLSNSINVFAIAQQHATDAEAAFPLAQSYNDHLTRLRQIQEIDLPVQIVPVHATLEHAINIFDLVNSQGTKLTDADLALTHVTGKWPQARRVMKAKMDELAQRHFEFDLTFMTRALTGTVTKKALYEHIHACPKVELLAGWEQLTGVLDYLTAFLAARAHVHSTDDINSANILIPLVVYLVEHECRFPNNRTIQQALHWLYLAQIWARYASQTDQRLEKDLQLVMREEAPWQALCNEIVDQRGRTQVTASDLEGRGTSHPLHRMLHILVKAQGAIDWFNGVPLGAQAGRKYQIYKHHIFSPALLYKSGYDSENHLHRKIVNEIANIAFLASDAPAKLNNLLPSAYFPQILESYPEALTKQFIPMDPGLWQVEHYEDFLEARRKLIALKLNEFLNALIAEPEPTHKRPISDLIRLGESATLEFKSTLQWNVVRNTRDENLRLSCLKTIGAFLNSEGGTLVIGVEDNGAIFGLERDFSLLQPRQNQDGFEQLLVNLMAERIGAEYARLIKIRFEAIADKTVCALDVDKAAGPAYVKGNDGKQEFFVRTGNTTRALDVQQAHAYIEQNWD